MHYIVVVERFLTAVALSAVLNACASGQPVTVKRTFQVLSVKQVGSSESLTTIAAEGQVAMAARPWLGQGHNTTLLHRGITRNAGVASSKPASIIPCF
jgi:hypothetical protein